MLFGFNDNNYSQHVIEYVLVVKFSSISFTLITRWLYATQSRYTHVSVEYSSTHV